jgi:hypothetical protein
MDNTKKTALRYSKVRVKQMLKDIEENAFKKLERALNSGAIGSDSEFLKHNSLLALTILEDVCSEYKIKTSEYKKEADNIRKFI